MNFLSKVLGAAAVALASALMAGCQGNPATPSGGPLPTPTFSTLEIPDLSGSNNWTTYSTSSPPAEILPTRGRAVKVWFYAPVGSTFSVSLRALDGTLTPLAQNNNTPAPAESGFFQIVAVNAALNPPLYTMYVRAPLSLPDLANYDILVVNRSLRSDVTDSSPMVVVLRQRKVFTVNVQVAGNGHVTSSPAGIECGTSTLGQPLTQCSHDFGPGTVNLNPGSNDLNTTKFIEWTGNCPAGVQVCTLALTGASASAATATFGPATATIPVSACPTAASIPGLRWIDLPACATGVIDSHPGIGRQCDAQGHFCCEPGPANANAPRCGGQGQIESEADCRHRAPTGFLRQPGGCYEVDAGP